MHLKRSDVDATVEYANKSRPALVEERRRSKIRIACVNRRAAGQQRMGECRPAVVLQWAKYWIGVDLVARAIQITAAIIATDVVAMSDKAAAIIKDVDARGACFQVRVPKLERAR